MQKIMKYKTSIGITLALLSALIYAIQTAIVKHTAPTVSTPVLVFIQSIVCFLCIIPFIFAQGKSKAIKQRRCARERQKMGKKRWMSANNVFGIVFVT